MQPGGVELLAGEGREPLGRSGKAVATATDRCAITERALATIGAVLLGRGGVAAGVGFQYCTAKVVRMQVGEGVAFAHGDALTAKEVVFGDCAACRVPLGRIVGERIVGAGAIGVLLDADAIVIINVALIR